MGLIFQRRWDFLCVDGRCIRRVLKTISGRYLVSVWALYFKGAGIFLLTVEDDLRTILGIGVGLIFQRRWYFLIDC